MEEASPQQKSWHEKDNKRGKIATVIMKMIKKRQIKKLERTNQKLTFKHYKLTPESKINVTWVFGNIRYKLRYKMEVPPRSVTPTRQQYNKITAFQLENKGTQQNYH